MAEKLGATGGFPHGKLNGSDEGGIRFAVGEDGGNVVINFGTPVAWLGMPPQQAIALATCCPAASRERKRSSSTSGLTLTATSSRR